MSSATGSLLTQLHSLDFWIVFLRELAKGLMAAAPQGLVTS